MGLLNARRFFAAPVRSIPVGQATSRTKGSRSACTKVVRLGLGNEKSDSTSDC
jgi:hypothetical protein